VDQQDTTMANFYQLEEAAAPQGKAAKYYDEEGKFKWDVQSSSSGSGSGSEDEEEEAEVEVEEGQDEEDNVWDELDKEEEEARKEDEEVEIGYRLAL